MNGGLGPIAVVDSRGHCETFPGIRGPCLSFESTQSHPLASGRSLTEVKEGFRVWENRLTYCVRQDWGALLMVDTPKVTTHVPGVCLCAELCAWCLPCWQAWSLQPQAWEGFCCGQSELQTAHLSWPCGFQGSDLSLGLYICFPPKFRRTCHPRVVLVETSVNVCLYEALC